MTRIITRFASTFLTPLFCSLGALYGCGQDEFVAPPAPPDGGSGEGPEPSTSTPSPTSTSTSTSPTTTGPVSPAGPAASQTRLGTACVRDNDCGSGLTCLTASSDEWLGGGAPNGICTADCSTGGHAQCMGIAVDSFCIGVSDTQAFCVALCDPGSNGGECQQRPDVACDFDTLSDSATAFCRPMCRGDEDCDGRKCDLGNGACYDELLEGDGFGASCDPTEATSGCSSGLCLGGSTEGTAEAGFCSGFCTVGEECASADGVLSGGDGFCLNAADGTGAGDLGLCYQVCDCDADCGAEKFLCARVPSFVENLGVQGVCVEFDAEFSAESGIELGIECASGADAGDAMSPLDGAADAMSLADGAPLGDAEPVVSPQTMADAN